MAVKPEEGAATYGTRVGWDPAIATVDSTQRSPDGTVYRYTGQPSSDGTGHHTTDTQDREMGHKQDEHHQMG